MNSFIAHSSAYQQETIKNDRKYHSFRYFTQVLLRSFRELRFLPHSFTENTSVSMSNNQRPSESNFLISKLDSDFEIFFSTAPISTPISRFFFSTTPISPTPRFFFLQLQFQIQFKKFLLYDSDFNSEKLLHFLTIISKDKTSQTEKNSFNALKCTLFTLKNPIFSRKKKQVYGYYHFQTRFLFPNRIPF